MLLAALGSLLGDLADRGLALERLEPGWIVADERGVYFAPGVRVRKTSRLLGGEVEPAIARLFGALKPRERAVFLARYLRANRAGRRDRKRWRALMRS